MGLSTIEAKLKTDFNPIAKLVPGSRAVVLMPGSNMNVGGINHIGPTCDTDGPTEEFEQNNEKTHNGFETLIQNF